MLVNKHFKHFSNYLCSTEVSQSYRFGISKTEFVIIILFLWVNDPFKSLHDLL